MAFKFKITKVEKLPGAGIGVIDGTVVAGTVTTGQEVVLIHQGQRLPLQVAGVVLETCRAHRDSAELSLSFKLKQPAFAYAQSGDELVAA
jgi:hypothetical protein